MYENVDFQIYNNLISTLVVHFCYKYDQRETLRFRFNHSTKGKITETDYLTFLW